MAHKTILITTLVLLLASQLVYNVWGPRLIGKALNIHPIVVVLAFLVGYRIGGVWGAIFAVPVASVLFIVAKELIRYWREEADRS